MGSGSVNSMSTYCSNKCKHSGRESSCDVSHFVIVHLMNVVDLRISSKLKHSVLLTCLN